MSRTEMAPAGSVEQEDPDNKLMKKQKNRRPANTAFRQQRLRAWQPILTPKTVLPIFFVVGIIFAPLGGLMLWASESIQELTIDYTHCNDTATSTYQDLPTSAFSSSFKSTNSSSVSRPQWKKTTQSVRPPYAAVEVPDTPVCTIQFDIPNDIGPPVYLYYRLTNFYQNHRRYVKSLDTDQLKGQALSGNTIGGSACNPIRNAPNGKPYYPCGLIANSIFNDTIFSPTAVNPVGSQAGKPYVMTNTSIAWGSDANLFKKTAYQYDQVSPPPNWHNRYPNGYTANGPGAIPDLSKYEEFQVWMRTAGLPTFSKLALRNDDDVMQSGLYTIEIYDYFPVEIYAGTKTLLISTRSVLGGKNSFLGIAYVAIGGLCIVLGVLFAVANLVRPRKLGDHTYLSWNNDSHTSGTTTGAQRRQA